MSRPALVAGGRPWRTRSWVLLAFLGALAIYSAGAAPTLLDSDSAELQAVAITGGVGHTTGYPLFAIIGWLFAHVPFGDPAFRVTLMSSVFGAACVAQIVVIGVELGFAPAVAFAAAVLYGAGFAFWAAALRAEVYTLSTFIFLIAYWLVLVALRTGERRHRLLAALLLGLSLAGQLSCAPAVGVLGIALAWDAFRRRGGLAEVWPLPLLCLAGGLPYLYTAWADAHAIGLDYLRAVADPSFFPATGVPDAHFHSEWQRVGWLVFGRNLLPHFHDTTTLKGIVRNTWNGSAMLALFELGPVATLLLVPGWARLWAARRGECVRLAALVALSSLFAARVVNSPGMYPIFMLYALVPLALVAALGLETALAPWTDRGPAWTRKALLVPALAVLTMAPTHALRVWAYTHPIPPGRWQPHGEDPDRRFYLLWRFHDPYASRNFARAAVRAIPESSLVIGSWHDMPILYYCRYVEHARADLSLQPDGYPRYLYRVRVWQEQHDLARTPIVFLDFLPELQPHVVQAESLQILPDRRIYVIRKPLVRLPAGSGSAFD